MRIQNQLAQMSIRPYESGEDFNLENQGDIENKILEDRFAAMRSGMKW